MEMKEDSEPYWITKVMEILERVNDGNLRECECPAEMKKSNVGFRTQEPTFDFLAIAYSCIEEKSDRGFLSYHDAYRVFGQRFCFRKAVTRDILRTMSGRGTLLMKKRGIQLL